MIPDLSYHRQGKLNAAFDHIFYKNILYLLHLTQDPTDKVCNSYD